MEKFLYKVQKGMCEHVEQEQNSNHTYFFPEFVEHKTGTSYQYSYYNNYSDLWNEFLKLKESIKRTCIVIETDEGDINLCKECLQDMLKELDEQEL